MFFLCWIKSHFKFSGDAFWGSLLLRKKIYENIKFIMVQIWRQIFGAKAFQSVWQDKTYAFVESENVTMWEKPFYTLLSVAYYKFLLLFKYWGLHLFSPLVWKKEAPRFQTIWRPKICVIYTVVHGHLGFSFCKL